MSSLMYEMSKARQSRMEQARDYGATDKDLVDLYHRLEEEYDCTQAIFDIDEEYISQLPVVRWADVGGVAIDTIGGKSVDIAPVESDQDRVIRESKEADQASVEMGVAVALIDAALERIKQERQGDK